MVIADFYHSTGPMWFMFMTAAFVIIQIPTFFWIRRNYVYRKDRPRFGDETSKLKQIKIDEDISNMTILEEGDHHY